MQVRSKVLLMFVCMLAWAGKNSAAAVTAPEKEEDLPKAIEGFVEGQKKALSTDSYEREMAQKQARAQRDAMANQILSLRAPVKPAEIKAEAPQPKPVLPQDRTDEYIFWAGVGSVGLLTILIALAIRKELVRRRIHEARLAESRQRQARLFKG